MLAKRSTVTATSGRRRAKPRRSPRLGRVLGEAPAGRVLRLDPLAEHGRVAGRGPVDAGGGLHHQPAHPGRLLAGAEQLHGADDVGLLHRGAVGGAQAGGADAEVHDGVHPVLGEHPGQCRAAQVELVEAVRGGRAGRLLGRQPGRLHVHADDQVHAGEAADLGGEAGTEMACHAGDEHDHAHGAAPHSLDPNGLRAPYRAAPPGRETTPCAETTPPAPGRRGRGGRWKRWARWARPGALTSCCDAERGSSSEACGASSWPYACDAS